MDRKQQLLNAFIRLDEKSVKSQVYDALHGEDPLPASEIISVLEEGMQQVGEIYESGRYFIADLIMSAIIFKNMIKLPEIESSISAPSTVQYTGTIVIGSVMTDKHDIGKDLFKDMAMASGIRVIDLGVDVPKTKFAEALCVHRPDILCLSALLTSAIHNMKETVDYLAEQGLRDVRILIAGNPLSKNACEYVGADAFTKNISEGLHICLDWLAENSKHE